MNNNLIFDIGVGSGQDTYFYLNKGFKVIAVEADPIQFDHLQKTFADPIADGSLILINAVASNSTGATVSFYRNDVQQYTSSINPGNHSKEYQVSTVDYASLVDQFGTPHYCKIDIEGEDFNFLPATSTMLPNYMSAELTSADAIDKLYQLGYKRFKLVNQFYNQVLYNNYVYTGVFTSNAVEGSAFSGKFPLWLNPHSVLEWSGLFGKELGNQWFTYNEVKIMYGVVQNIHTKFPGEVSGGHNAYDCHATGYGE